MRNVPTRCDSCGAALEACDVGELSGIHRAALVAGAGLARVRADPVATRPRRVHVLAVFRRDGTTIAESIDAYARLTGEGIIETPAPMRLLADRLTAAGATVSLEALPRH